MWRRIGVSAFLQAMCGCKPSHSTILRRYIDSTKCVKILEYFVFQISLLCLFAGGLHRVRFNLQVCCAGAYFNTPIEKLSSPYIFVVGYRSPKLQLDFRTNDLGIVFKDINFSPLESSFSIAAVGPSHTVEVNSCLFTLMCTNLA